MDRPTTTVIVCTYTMARLELTLSCLAALDDQTVRPDEVIVVVDHADAVLDAIRAARPEASVLPNLGRRGLSTARNTGIALATGDIIAFLDDDARPDPGWLGALVEPFADPQVAVTGGLAIPDWAGGEAPAWFPPEFLWVVGCSFTGQVRDGVARNPLGCSMAFRRTAFEAAGDFDADVGRLGTIPLGCEETELCIRIARALPGATVRLTSASIVRHHVPRERQTVRYFLRRCFYEGVSKAVIRSLAGAQAVATEGRYAVRTLPAGMFRAMHRAIRGPRRLGASSGIIAIPVGLAVTAVGFGLGMLRAGVGGMRAAEPGRDA